jgi:hypothetical protein
LLDDADADVLKWLKGALRGEYAVLAANGWKDKSRDSVNGVNLSVNGKVSSCFTNLMSMLTFFEDLSSQSYFGYGTQ